MATTDFAACRLRVHSVDLRASLIRDVETCLLAQVAAEACPKPLHLLLPLPGAKTSSQHAARPPSSPGVHRGVSVEDGTQMVSCVLTSKGELLVVDHTDEGLAARCPRSLGFIAPGMAIPPQPDQPLQGQALRRYPVVLLLYRSASCRNEDQMAGCGAAADIATSVSVETEELLLLAPSRNQYDALRRAVEGYGSAAQHVPAGSGLKLTPDTEEDDRLGEGAALTGDGFVGLDLENAEEDLETGCSCDSQPSEALGGTPRSIMQPTESLTALSHPTDVTDHAEAAAAHGPASWALSLAAAGGNEEAMAASDNEATASAHITVGTGISDGGPAHHALPASGQEAAESATSLLREQITAARESILRVLSCHTPSSSPSIITTLLRMTAAEENNVYSSLAEAIAAATGSSSIHMLEGGCDGLDAGTESDNNANLDASVSGRRLTEQLELRAGATALLAGLDTAMVLEIRRFVMGNARLRSQLRQGQGADSDVSAQQAGVMAASTVPEPIVLSGGPTSPSFATVCPPLSLSLLSYQPSLFAFYSILEA